MQVYRHERKTEQDQGPANTLWPLMTTDGLDLDDCKRYLKERGLSWALAEANGWYPSRSAMDSFLRIVIPARSALFGHVYWQARAVSENVHRRYQTPRGPRHGALIKVEVDPLEIDPGVSDSVVIVEGPMDALACAACGYDSIAIMGITPGELAIAHLINMVDRRPALVVLDNEPLAQSEAGRIAMRLASSGGKAHVAKLGTAKDLAAIRFEKRNLWLANRMEEL